MLYALCWIVFIWGLVTSNVLLVVGAVVVYALMNED
jgi:hypothetical protein